jgi:hypothetical protein
VLIGDLDEVVERPIDRTQTDWKLRVGGARRPVCARRRNGLVEVDLVWSGSEERSAGRVELGDLDLVKDEPQIFVVDDKAVSDRCGLRTRGGHRVKSQQQHLADQEHVAQVALVSHSHEAHLKIPPLREAPLVAFPLRAKAFDKQHCNRTHQSI